MAPDALLSRNQATLRWFPASLAIINVVAPMKGGLPIFSRRFTRSIAVVAAIVVVGGSACGVVSVTSGGPGTAIAAAPGEVIPFTRGAQSTSKQVGQIPANYTQGSGTVVSGTQANKATQAALAAYPGGIVDRVVKLSNGEYEVHNIGVSWPHHIFVNQNFKVVGAN